MDAQQSYTESFETRTAAVLQWQKPCDVAFQIFFRKMNTQIACLMTN